MLELLTASLMQSFLSSSRQSSRRSSRDWCFNFSALVWVVRSFTGDVGLSGPALKTQMDQIRLSSSASVSAREINIIFPIPTVYDVLSYRVVYNLNIKMSICNTIFNTTGKTLRASHFWIVWKDKYNKAATWQWETTFLFLVSSRAQHQTVGNFKYHSTPFTVTEYLWAM